MNFEASDIDKLKLPTNRQVIEYFLYLRETDTSSVKRNKNLVCYIQVVIRVIIELWSETMIPILEKTTIRKLLTNLLSKRDKIIRKHDKYVPSEWNKLFRISKCKCFIELIGFCSCPNTRRIPPNKINFVIDQCGPRLLTLRNNSNNIDIDPLDAASSIQIQSLYTDEYVPCSSDEDEGLQDDNNEKTRTEPQLMVSDITLKNFSAALDRTNTSNRFGSLLATTIIKDLKISIAKKVMIEHDDISEKILNYFNDLVIDKNKIQRERDRLRAEARATSTGDSTLKCISYDGKKTKR